MTDLVGSIAQFTYNAQGLPATMRDARGNLSSYLYNANGDRTSLTDQLNRVTTVCVRGTPLEAKGNRC